MKLTEKLTTIFDHVINLGAYLACVFVTFTMLLVSAEVISRKFLNRPIPWSVQFSEYSLCYIAFLGAAWLLRKEGHIKVDIVVTRLSPRHQALLNLATSIVGAALCLLIAGWGVVTTWDLFQRGIYDPTLIKVPKGPLVIVIPIGCFLLFIQFLRKAHRHLMEWKGHETSGEIKTAEIISHSNL